MKIKLENEFFTAHISTLGAELTSLVKKETQQEYIWDAQEAYWARHSPTLFPITGRLPDLCYLHGDDVYQMPAHGFAKDSVFTVISQAETQVTLLLSSNETTFTMYPFLFELICQFTLSAQGVSITRTVRNKGTGCMYYSIGEHTGLHLQQLGWNLLDCIIGFDKPQEATIWTLKDGLLFAPHTYKTKIQELLLEKTLFEQYGCLVFSQMDYQNLSLKNKTTKEHVQLQVSEPCPALVIWVVGNDSPFICVEPWYGLPSQYGKPTPLQQKKEIIQLMPHQQKSYTYTIKV